jgi:hypothetical protein
MLAAVLLSRPDDRLLPASSCNEPVEREGLLLRCWSVASSSSSSITRVVIKGGTSGALESAAGGAANRAGEASETDAGTTETATADLGTAFLGCFLPMPADAVGSDLAALEFDREEGEVTAAVEDRPGAAAESAPEAAREARRRRRAAFSCWCRRLSASCIQHEPPNEQMPRKAKPRDGRQRLSPVFVPVALVSLPEYASFP